MADVGYDYALPGFAGHIPSLKDTLGATPAIAQHSAKMPATGEYLSSTTRQPVPSPGRDPCNHPETYKPHQDNVNLWPSQQSTGKQPSAKPPLSQLQLGDNRLDPFHTAYRHDFPAPLAGGEVLRSPLRSKVPRQPGDFAQLYESALRRCGPERLETVMAHMKERIAGKMANRSDNAFRLRRLFKMYDTNHTGMISTEDFRVMTESFGMQLDDDSLLAVFQKYDKQRIGEIPYIKLMEDVLDDELLALYKGSSC